MLGSQKNQNANADPKRSVVKNVIQHVFARGRVSETGFPGVQRSNRPIFDYAVRGVRGSWLENAFLFRSRRRQVLRILVGSRVNVHGTTLQRAGGRERRVNVNERRKGSDRKARAEPIERESVKKRNKLGGR